VKSVINATNTASAAINRAPDPEENAPALSVKTAESVRYAVHAVVAITNPLAPALSVRTAETAVRPDVVQTVSVNHAQKAHVTVHFAPDAANAQGVVTAPVLTAANRAVTVKYVQTVSCVAYANQNADVIRVVRAIPTARASNAPNAMSVHYAVNVNAVKAVS